MFGAIAGDVIGSVFEWNNYKGTDFELFHPTSDFTDDMACLVGLLASPTPNQKITFCRVNIIR